MARNYDNMKTVDRMANVNLTFIGLKLIDDGQERNVF